MSVHLLVGYLCLGGVIALFSGCSRGDDFMVQGSQVSDVSATEAAEMIRERASDKDFVILDVRTPSEYEVDHLSGAVNIDFYADDFSVQLEGLARQKTYLVYCGSGVRSSQSLTAMSDMGFVEVYNVVGGMTELRKLGGDEIQLVDGSCGCPL